MAENIRNWAPMDAQTRFCEDKVVTASGPIQSAGADIILAIGPGYKEFSWVVNVTAITYQGAAPENYTLILQGTNDANFATATNVAELARKNFGAGSAFTPNSAVANRLTGRYVIPASNDDAGTTYKNLRLVAVAAGTAPSITFDSWLSIDI